MQNSNLNDKIQPSDARFEFGKVTTSGTTRTITLQREYAEMIYFNIGSMPNTNVFLPREVTFTAPNKVSFILKSISTTAGQFADITTSFTHGYIFVGK